MRAAREPRAADEQGGEQRGNAGHFSGPAHDAAKVAARTPARTGMIGIRIQANRPNGCADGRNRQAAWPACHDCGPKSASRQTAKESAAKAICRATPQHPAIRQLGDLGEAVQGFGRGQPEHLDNRYV
jgi:hypothetical protein